MEGNSKGTWGPALLGQLRQTSPLRNWVASGHFDLPKTCTPWHPSAACCILLLCSDKMSIPGRFLYLWPRQEGTGEKKKGLVGYLHLPTFASLSFDIGQSHTFWSTKPNFTLVFSLLSLIILKRENIILRLQTFFVCFVFASSFWNAGKHLPVSVNSTRLNGAVVWFSIRQLPISSSTYYQSYSISSGLLNRGLRPCPFLFLKDSLVYTKAPRI